MKKILVLNSVHTRPGQENSEKKIAKKFKKLKNLIPALFPGKTGWDRPRKKKKKILVANSVYTLPGQENSERSSKKIQKIKKHSSVIFSQNGMRLAEKEKKEI